MKSEPVSEPREEQENLVGIVFLSSIDSQECDQNCDCYDCVDCDNSNDGPND